MEYRNSKTYENVVNAYRGEIAGVVLYSFLSEIFGEKGKKNLVDFFKRLSNEEQGHANILKKYIDMDANKYELSKEEIENLKNSLKDPMKSLEMFVIGEKKAGEEGYPNYSKIASEEGYEDIAKMFLTLAKVELKHGAQIEEILKDEN